MDRTPCPTFILPSYLQGAFIWLQVAVSLAGRFDINFSNQNDTAQGELPHLPQINRSLARHHDLR